MGFLGNEDAQDAASDGIWPGPIHYAYLQCRDMNSDAFFEKTSIASVVQNLAAATGAGTPIGD